MSKYSVIVKGIADHSPAGVRAFLKRFGDAYKMTAEQAQEVLDKTNGVLYQYDDVEQVRYAREYLEKLGAVIDVIDGEVDEVLGTPDASPAKAAAPAAAPAEPKTKPTRPSRQQPKASPPPAPPAQSVATAAPSPIRTQPPLSPAVAAAPRTAAPTPPPRPQNLSDLEAALFDIIGEYASQPGVFLAGGIPAPRLANASKACQLPDTERALALIDLTAFGSGKDAVIVGSKGLYLYSWMSRTKGPVAISYQELGQRSFAAAGTGEISLGNDQYLHVMSAPCSREIILAVLDRIKKLV